MKQVYTKNCRDNKVENTTAGTINSIENKDSVSFGFNIRKTINRTVTGFFVLFLSLMSVMLHAQTTVITYNSSSTFVVPSGVTSLTVYIFGAGGGGGGGAVIGGTKTHFANGGGGGGGAASVNTITVSSGQSYTVTVGAGGSAGTPTANGGTGGASQFFGTAGTFTAAGGGGGVFSTGASQTTSSGAGGAGGTTGTGTIFTGGAGSAGIDGSNGSPASTSTTGSGGGGAGSGGNGSGASAILCPGAGGSGGTGVYPGGNGAFNPNCQNIAANSDGVAGAQPGGGGSSNNSYGTGGSNNGGVGGAGEVVVTYATPNCTVPSAATGIGFTKTSSTITGTFSGTANGYLVIRTTTSTAPTAPTNGSSYTAGTSALGGFIVSTNLTTGFIDNGNNNGLASSTQYWYWVYAFNNTSCLNGPLYSSSSLNGTATTNACSANTLYWGGLGATNSGTTGTDFNTAANWSTSSSAYVASTTIPNSCTSVIYNITMTAAGAVTDYTSLSANTTIASLTMSATLKGSAGNIKLFYLDGGTFTFNITGNVSLSSVGANGGVSHELLLTGNSITIGGTTTVGGASDTHACLIGNFDGATQGTWAFGDNVTFNALAGVNNPGFVSANFNSASAQTLTNNTNNGVDGEVQFINVAVNAPSLTLAGLGTFWDYVDGGNLTIANSSTLILSSGQSLNQFGAAAAGTLTLGTGSILQAMDGATGASNPAINTTNFPGGYATYALTAGTVVYDAAVNQKIYGVPTYGNLKINNTGSAVATANSALTISGNLTIASGATFSGGTATSKVAGNWTNNGTFTGATSTITFNGAIAQTINAGSSSFNKINITNTSGGVSLLTNNLAVGSTFVLNGAGGFNANGLTNTVTGLTTVSSGTYTAGSATQTFTGGLTVSGGTFTGSTGNVSSGSVTLSSGTLTAPSGIFTVSGDWAQSGGTFTPGSNTVTFNGSSLQNLSSGGTAFNNISITNTSGGVSLLTNNLAVGGTFLLNGAGGFTANGLTTTVTGLTTLSSGTYAASTAAQTFNGGLTINGGTFTGSTGNVTSTTVSLSSGTLTAPSGIFTVTGNWAQTGGTFTPGSNTVTFNGGGAISLNSGGTSFNNIIMSATNTVVTLAAALTTIGTFTNTNATFAMAGLATSVGSLAGAGINGVIRNGVTGTQTFTVGSDNASTGYAGALNDISAGHLALTKTGTGTLTLSGTNSYTGASTISGGTLNLTGSLNSGSAVSIAGGAALSGTGTAAGTVAVSGTISPGGTGGIGTIGALTTGALTLNSGGTYYVDINNITGTAGTNWDEIIAGTLTTPASGTFTISVNGTITGFNAASVYSWLIGTYTGSAPSGAHIAVLNNIIGATGNFSLSIAGHNITLNYTGPSVITSGTTGSSTYGTAGSYQISATNSPTSYNATLNPSGALPTGFSVNTSNGLISVLSTSPAGNYSLLVSATNAGGTGTQVVTYTVNTASLSITANNGSKTYGQTKTFAGTEFTTSGLKNSDAVTSVTLTSTGAAAGAAVGSYPISASAAVGSGLSNYTIAYTNGTLTVGAAALTITANSSSKTYGATKTFAGTEFTTSGLQNSDAVTSVTLTSTGAAAGAAVDSYPISASAAVGSGLSNYTIAYTNGTLTVGAAALTITANSSSKTYGQAVTFAGTEFTTSGLQNSDAVTSVTLTSAGAAAGAAVGSYPISASAAVGSGLSNYTIAYTNGTLTVGAAALTITANSSSKTYGQTVTFAGTEFTTSGLQNSDAVTSVTLTSAGAAAGAAVGSYPISASAAVGSGLSNYTISYTNGTLTVGAAALTITANSSSKTYGQTVTFAGTEFTTSGLVNGDAVSSVTLTSAGAAAGSAVGLYPISASAAVGSGLSNYTIAYTNGTLTVGAAALTITANSSSKTYGQTVTFAGTEFTTSGLQNSDAVTSVTLTSAGAAAGAAVGSYPISASAAVGSGLSNYTITYANGTLTVGGAALTITANSSSKTYGQTVTFAGTEFTTSSLQNGDAVTSVTLTSTGAAGSATVGSYPIVPSAAVGSGLSNYTITYTNGSLAVTPATLTITANNITKCNGATYTFAGTEFTTSGLVAGDGASVSSVTLTSAGAAAAAAAGPYPIAPSAAQTTGLNNNYTIVYVNGTLTVETPVVLTMIQVNPDCHGNPGSLSSTVTGGISPYTYKVNTGLNYNPSGTFVSTPLFSPLAPGYYAYAARDVNGCLAIAPGITISALTQTPVLTNNTPTPATTQVCYGSGITISTTPAGGATPYTFSLNGGSFVSSANRFFYVGAGTYTITVKDNVGCTYNTNTISVTQPSAALSLTSSVTNPTCTVTTGSITVTAAGGYSNSYTYSDNGGTSFQSSNVFSALSAGSYSLVVKDANGCSITGTATVSAHQSTLTTSPITIGTGTSQICYGSTTTISTTPSGGTAPYTYSLDGGAFVSSSSRYFAVVGPGTHTISVDDAGGCTVNAGQITISQPSSALTMSSSATNSTCVSSTGSITVTAAGGYGGYSYSDNAGTSFQAGNSFSGLSAGTYNIVVKDANGCTVSGTATVQQPTLVALAISGNTQLCYGATTAISTTGSGGVSPYTYSLDATNTFVSSANRYFSVSAGSHTITVMDNQGCTVTAGPVVITQPAAPVSFMSATGGSGCSTNGIISVTPAGGYSGSYTYSDNGGTSYQAAPVFTGLGYGNYTVMVKDQNGCASPAAVVKLLALTSSAIQGTLTVCPNGTTTINTVPSGGTTPYTYSLDGGAYVPSSGRYFNVPAGSHFITVKDNAGCTYTTPSVNVTTVTCLGGGNGDNTSQKVITAGQVFKANAYPNPSNASFHLQLTSSSREDVQLIVTNILGVKVYETKGTVDQTFEFGGNFANGMYILQIKQGNDLHNIKLVKGN